MKKIAIILTFFGVIGMGQSLSGQQADVMYFMKDNPLQHNLNPAFQPKCNLYIGFPGASSMNFSLGNNSLTFWDIYSRQEVEGEMRTVSFLHPVMGQEGIDNFLSRLRKNTRLYMELSETPLAFGWRKNQSFFTFDLSTKVDVQLIVPKAIPTVFFRGVKEEDINKETDFNLQNLSLSSTLYSQIAFGYSRKIDEDWSVGGKLKLLLGHANVDTDFNDLSLTVSRERWLLQGNSSIRSAVPGITVNEDEDGRVDKVKFDDNIKFGKSFSGIGAGMDLGATYNPLENLQFSASVVDLGFIRWNKNLNKINKENDFEFDGIVYDINNDSIDYWAEYGDMLKEMFVLEKNPSAYSTCLTTKVHAGVEYSILDDKIGFGLLSKTYITKSKMFEELVLSSNFRPFYPLSVSVSYSLLNGRWSNLGFGMNLNAGPFNLFMCADNIPLKYGRGKDFTIPTNTKSTNFSFGINFIFGRNDKDKKNVELEPVMEEPLPEPKLTEPGKRAVIDDEDGIPDHYLDNFGEPEPVESEYANNKKIEPTQLEVQQAIGSQATEWVQPDPEDINQEEVVVEDKDEPLRLEFEVTEPEVIKVAAE